MLARSTGTSIPPLEHARLLNTVARMFDTYSSSLLALQKFKTGGKQHVVVQHLQQVSVGPGGQAVVTGRIRRGSRKGGRRRKNG